MLVAPIPDNEDARIDSLVRMNILSTSDEEIFDKIVRIAKQVLDVPIVLVSLVDADRQWFKACVGLKDRETPRDVSFCGHAIMHDSLFIIPDATQDERFADNPLVTGEPYVIFYAGRPLKNTEGFRVGTLCVIDHIPRQLSVEEQSYLNDLGNWVEQAFLTRQLAEHDVSWQLLFENMTVGFASHEIIENADGQVIDYRFIEINPAYEQLTGIVAKNALGRTVLELLPGTELYWIEVFGKVAQTGEPIVYENYSKELGKWYNVRAYRPRTGQFAVMITDITRTKLAEEELKSLTNDLQEKVKYLNESDFKLRELNESLEVRVNERTKQFEDANLSLKSTISRLERTQNELLISEKLASLGSMVAGISHELNTPIGNAVTLTSSLELNYNEMYRKLADGSLKKQELEELLRYGLEMSEVASRCVNQAAHLVQSFKQVAVDQTSEQRREFNLATVIDNNVATIVLSSNKDIGKITVLNEVPREVSCDSYPGALGQVIVNLIQNAIVHGLEAKESGLITLRGSVVSNYVQISISDNGSGMPASVLAHIFDPFFTTKLGSGGSGLGLWVSYRIMTTVLGGEISADSRPGMGATFNLRFPLVAPFKI